MKTEQIAKHLKDIGLKLSRVEGHELYQWITTPADIPTPPDYFYSAIHALRYWDIRALEQYQSLLALRNYLLSPTQEDQVGAIRNWIYGSKENPPGLIVHHLSCLRQPPSPKGRRLLGLHHCWVQFTSLGALRQRGGFSSASTKASV